MSFISLEGFKLCWLFSVLLYNSNKYIVNTDCMLLRFLIPVFMLYSHSLSLHTIYLICIHVFIPLLLHLHLLLFISLSCTRISYLTIIISHIFPPFSYSVWFTLPNILLSCSFFIALVKKRATDKDWKNILLHFLALNPTINLFKAKQLSTFSISLFYKAAQLL